jgi:hypothetical protein
VTSQRRIQLRFGWSFFATGGRRGHPQLKSLLGYDFDKHCPQLPR